MRPNTKKMYGLTHDLDGRPIVRLPRVVKIQIGQPKGPAVSTWIDETGQWRVFYASKDGKKYFAYRGGDLAEAKKIYDDLYNSALKDVPPGYSKGGKCAMRTFPAKLPYFTFNRQNGDGSYEPDWETIQAHGHCPTELEVVLMNADAFEAQYQMWSASQLLCTGDGINAERVVTLAAGHEKEAAAAAAAGRKMFPIVNGCYTCGCPYGKPGTKNGKPTAPPCKPHGRIQLQLLSSLRLGGTAQIDTTSFRSVNHLFSCLYAIREFTGAGNAERGWAHGVPLLLCLRPFKTDHGRAYAVSLEFRAESVAALREKILTAGKTFRAVIEGTPVAAPLPASRRIEAGSAIEAQQMTREFYEEVPDDPDTVESAPDMATKTVERMNALTERLVQMKGTAAAVGATTGLEVVEAEVVEAGDEEEEDEDAGDANEDYGAPTGGPAPTDEPAPPTEAEMRAATIAADKADREKERRRGGTR